MSLPHLLLCSVAIFCVLYAPQPLLSLFAESYQVAPAKAGMLMSLTMLPLAIAPICYGLLFTKRNPLRIIKASMLMLALCCIGFAFSGDFQWMMAIRFVQGLLLPAALTAMTGYLGRTYQHSQLKRSMSWYIGSTIAGGYLGRTLAANFAVWFDWQSFYLLNAITLIILALWIKPQRAQVVSSAANHPLAYLKPLRQADLLGLYGAVFCMFFCFAALLNYLPFILSNDYKISDPRLIGWVYTGYLVGACLSLSTPLLSKLRASMWQILSGLFALYCLTIVGMLWHSFWLFLVLFTLFCACMFMIHASAAPLANQLSKAEATVTNGAYVSFYYCGGALGSYLPGLIYQRWGLSYFLLSLLLVCSAGLLLVWRNHSRARPDKTALSPKF
ncbi:MFS transporter [Pseudoalteromonas rubra]|uniref:Major facilitator transporter n=1 Tax=Pseudoalteromonas rubra TaxID=43658 RepID=A0A0F4QY10_9GAMM|nr:MFS transporter [Pseudoalteromonas rubra]KJZ12229.1 major facilitator transporter [Pseudoalteromonas rubra]